MEILFELLFEIIIEGSVELGASRKVPMVLRVIAILVFLAIYGFLIVVLFMVGYGAAKDGNTGVAVMVYLIDAFILVAVIHMIRKKFKEHRH